MRQDERIDDKTRKKYEIKWEKNEMRQDGKKEKLEQKKEMRTK